MNACVLAGNKAATCHATRCVLNKYNCNDVDIVVEARARPARARPPRRAGWADGGRPQDTSLRECMQAFIRNEWGGAGGADMSVRVGTSPSPDKKFHINVWARVRENEVRIACPTHTHAFRWVGAKGVAE